MKMRPIVPAGRTHANAALAHPAFALTEGC